MDMAIYQTRYNIFTASIDRLRSFRYLHISFFANGDNFRSFNNDHSIWKMWFEVDCPPQAIDKGCSFDDNRALGIGNRNKNNNEEENKKSSHGSRTQERSAMRMKIPFCV